MRGGIRFERYLAFLISLFLCNLDSFAEDYLIMDDESETFLVEIVDKLKEALNFERDIKVYISSDQSLNAAATQYGDIIVNTGAILQCQNSKELIAILAHEIGHIEGVHIATYLSSQGDFLRAGLVPALIGALASVCAQNGAPLMAGVLGGQSIGTGMALSKLRQKESIADTKAAQAIQKLGWYSVFDAMISIHEKLASNSAVFNKYLSTHPQSQDRVSKFRQYRDRFSNCQTPEKTKELLKNIENKFQTIKHKLQALTASQEMLPSIYANPASLNDKYARAIALYRMNKYQEAINLIDDLLKGNPDSVYYSEIKAMCLINLKKCSKAADVAWRILEKGKGVHRDLSIIFADAVYEGGLKGRISQAIKTLKKVLARSENDLSTINLLGKLYSLQGDEPQASFYAAKSAFLFGDIRTAKLHAAKAAKSNNPITQRNAQDILNISED